MSNIQNGSYDIDELADYFGISKSQIGVTRNSDNDRVDRRYSDFWDGTHHPGTGEKLKFDREMYDMKTNEPLCAVFTGKDGQEYCYVKEDYNENVTDANGRPYPPKSIGKQMSEDRQEFYCNHPMSEGMSRSNQPEQGMSMGEAMAAGRNRSDEQQQGVGRDQSSGRAESNSNEYNETNTNDQQPSQNQSEQAQGSGSQGQSY